MEYRKMGSLDWEVSALGFGAMRLPVDDKQIIIEEEAIKMIRYAIDNGVNYIDTAYPYHGGQSEIIVGKALKDGYREKVHLTTKLPMWDVKETDDFDKFLNEQMERLQTKPDIYLFHGLNKARLEKIKKLDLIPKMEAVKKQGLIKHIGFSFHDNIEVFKEIIDYYNWDCCQIQYNYLDINYQAGTEGLRYAGKKNIAVIIMEPIRGGKLFIPKENLHYYPEVKAIMESANNNRSMADWALQFIWNQPEVSVVLSGMSNMQQVIENLESASNSGIDILNEDELQTIEELRGAYENYNYVPCTSCGYCKPCPNYVNIPGAIRMVNEIFYWRDVGRERISYFYNLYSKKSKEEYETAIANGEEAEGAATLCIECGECLEKCPQQIDIPEVMKVANAIFEEQKPLDEVFD
jgi:predicted aldo/keto reductase-like oxidoreductase